MGRNVLTKFMNSRKEMDIHSFSNQTGRFAIYRRVLTNKSHMNTVVLFDVTRCSVLRPGGKSGANLQGPEEEEDLSRKDKDCLDICGAHVCRRKCYCGGGGVGPTT